MEGTTWDFKQISSCNNGTIMIKKDSTVLFSGSLKGGHNQGSEDYV
jgi:hypothetical protein